MNTKYYNVAIELPLLHMYMSYLYDVYELILSHTNATAMC